MRISDWSSDVCSSDLHFLARNESQRGRVDAIAVPAAIGRPIGEHMAQVAVAMRRPDFGTGHAVADVELFLHVFRFDRLGYAGPATMRFDLGGRKNHPPPRKPTHRHNLRISKK